MRFFVQIASLAAILLLFTGAAEAVDTVQSGPWDDTGTWSGGSIPTYGVDGTAQNGHHLELTNGVLAACKKLSVNASAAMTFSGGDLEGTNVTVQGVVTQATGTVRFSGVGNQGSWLNSTNGGGYVINGGVLSIGYGVQIGGNKGTAGEGLLTINGGKVTTAVLNVGYGGHGQVVVAGGELRSMAGQQTDIGKGAGNLGELTISSGMAVFTNRVFMGQSTGSTGIVVQTGGTIDSYDYFCFGWAGIGEYYMSGGTNIIKGTYYVANSGGSTARVVQTGGTILTDPANYVYIGQYGNGVYDLIGGELICRNQFRMGWKDEGTALMRISGGSFVVGTPFTMYADGDTSGDVVIEIIGSGCTNIDFQSDWDYDDEDTTNNTIRTYIDGGGISLIKVDGDADIENITLEIGITNGFEGRVGDYWPLVRVPDLNTISASGIVISNLNADEGYTFTTNMLYNSGGYDYLRLECLTIHPKATAIIIK